MKTSKKPAYVRIKSEGNLRLKTVNEASGKHLKYPICKKSAETDKTKNRFLPFCSERCRTIYLGAWLDGKYVIEGNEPTPDH